MEFKEEKTRWIGIVSITLIIQGIFYTTSLVEGNNGAYIRLTDLTCGVIGFSVGLITIFRKTKSLYKYIGIGFIIIGLAEYIKMLCMQSVDENKAQILNIIISSCIGNFEFLIAGIAIYLVKKKKSNAKSFKIYMVAMILNSIFILLGAKLNILEEIFWINGVFMVGVAIYIWKVYKITNYEYYIYVAGIILTCTMRLVAVSGYIYIFKVAMIFRVIAYFAVYQGVSSKIINLEISYIQNTVKQNNLKKENIEDKLQAESKKLVEVSKMKKREERHYYELIDKFSDGIFIYENNEIIYINKKGLDLMGVDSIDKYSEAILKEKIGFKKINEEGITEAKIFFKGKALEVNMYDVYIKDNQYILCIKDMTTINSYNEIYKKHQKRILKEKMKNDFYSNVSHELRTPITVINSAIELNKVNVAKENFENIKKVNIMIKRNCLRMIRTINNFIDANKISDGYLIPVTRVYNLVEVIENLVEATYETVKQNGSNIFFDSFEREIFLEIDKDLIERVILNLISNGLKHKEKEQGGTIEIDIYNVRECVMIVITNNGRIISEFEEGFLFDEFTKINKKLNRENEGSGLGLYLSKAIIKAHNGWIKFKRRNGLNTFLIKLPKVKDIDKESVVNSNINSLEEKVQLEFADLNFE